MSKNKGNENKFICAVCEKDLEIQKIICLKQCGHVMCKKCMLNICDKDKKCSLCGIKYSPSDIIKLSESGTSYCVHNKVEIKRNEPGFKC